MRGVGFHRPLVGLVTLALLMAGLLGAYGYWESYYQHRGFATVAYLPHARKGRHETVTFYSAALHREADYLALLPPGYDPTHERYPVYYLLHGSPGRPQVYYAIAGLHVRISNLLSQHQVRPMILIYPDGRISQSTFSDSEWANTPSGSYESYVLEVVHDVDQRFATLARRQNRVIGGFSAGGYGATNIALHNLSVFGNLQSWSGYYIQNRTGVFAHASRAALAYNSPLEYVRQLGRQLAVDPLRAFLFTGRDDNVSPQVEPMAQALATRGSPVSYALYRGGHDWQLWHAHLNQLLVLASNDVSEPLLPGSGTAGTLTPGVVPIPHGAGRRHRRHGSEQIPTGHGGPEHGGPLQLRRLTHQLAPYPPGFEGRGPGPSPPGGARPGGGGAGLGGGGGAGSGGARSGGGVGAGIINRGRAATATFVAYRPRAIPGPRLRQDQPGAAGGRRSGRGRRDARGKLGIGELLVGLILALASAALINLGFLLQHRGLGRRSTAGLASTLREAVHNRSWLAGQAIGWVGFAGQIAAVAIAPLSLVQAFAAGGLALSLPLAARIFSHQVTREQLLAVLLIAISLAALPIGFSTARDHLHPGSLAATVAACLAVALTVSVLRSTALRAIAAGLFYGVADAAIKAVSVGWRLHGGSALLSGWTALALIATFAGFLAFQSALSDDDAVSPISLMNALAALAALASGLIAFGESLGTNPLAVGAHLVAIAVVFGCVPVLAAAQAGIARDTKPGDGRAAPPSSPLRPEYGPG